MNRFNWTLSQYKKINWEIFAPVFHRQTSENLNTTNGDVLVGQIVKTTIIYYNAQINDGTAVKYYKQ